MTEGFWTEARVDELVVLHATGLSVRLIGVEFGVSKSTISGKLDRMGLKRPGMRGAPKPIRVRPAPKPAPTPPAEPAGAHRCDLFGLTARSCRWPVTDGPPFLFCGEPEADFPAVAYCRFHAERATNRSRDQEAA